MIASIPSAVLVGVDGQPSPWGSMCPTAPPVSPWWVGPTPPFGHPGTPCGRRWGRAAFRGRSAERGVTANAHPSSAALDGLAPLTAEATASVGRCLRSDDLSARGFDAVRRLARSTAGLDQAGPVIQVIHMSEALALRWRRNPHLGEEGW